jgi:thiamine-monophosphate kinase
MLDNIEWKIINKISKDNCFIGDDCVFLEKENQLITTDQFVEHIHFDFNFMPAKSIGWRLMAANASDVLAMGGKPEKFLLNFAIPKEKISLGEKVIDGIIEFANEYNIKIIGGDTTSSENCFFAVTMIGTPENKIWFRSNLKENDDIYIAHYPGLSKCGFIALKNKISGFEESKERFLYPDPFRYFPFFGEINGAIDLSDSLFSELTILAKASNKLIKIDLDLIPIHKEIKNICQKTGKNYLEFIMGGGEEFFLILSSPKEIPGFFKIGKVFKGEGKVELYKKNRIISHNNFNIFNHFS